MLELDIVRIGNSKGIRIPFSLLKQCGINKKVSVEVREKSIVLKAIESPREGWATAFKSMSQNGDDELLFPDELDNNILEEWDED